MAFNGSGVFTLVSGNPVITGTTISSTWANNTLSDIATGLSTTITKDGQSTPTANIPMGGFKFTGLGAGTATGNSLRFEQLFSQGTPVALASAATVDIGGQTSVAVEISGTTTITSLGTNYNGPRFVRFTGALLLTHNATTLNLPGAASITTVAGDIAVFYPNLALNGWNLVSYQRSTGIPVVPLGYISGLTLSNDGSDPTNDIDIASGMATDSTGTYLMPLTGPFIKRLDAAWAVGSGNGGLDTGSIANTTYHVWLIRKDSDGSIDALFSTSATAPTMPAGYTYKANIGAIIRSGGAILLFTQVGNEVLWKASALDFDSGTNTTSSPIAVRAPLGIQTDVSLQLIYNNTVSGNFVLYVSSPDQNDETASLAAARVTVVNPSTSVFGTATVSVRTNTSAQIRIRSDDANNTTRISTRGFSYIRR